MSDVRFVVVTGVSGAGKSAALRCLEDLGFFCVDNMPSALIPKFAEIIAQSNSNMNRVALGIDIREGQFFDRVLTDLDTLEEMGFGYEILFLDASDESLIRRFSETRRRHPLGDSASLSEVIRGEREKLSVIRQHADWCLDTSTMNVHELKEAIATHFAVPKESKRLAMLLVAFSYKYGIPPESDLVFDVRFLPNPYYVQNLRSYTGNDRRVKEFVLDNSQTQEFLEKLKSLLSFLLPRYLAEGKAYLTISVGCTGGRHRSVVIANVLKEFLDGLGQDVRIRYRDIER
jgi:UPF0042 nucleotide-binding protein